MKLDQFVSETLKQIINGVSSAQAHAEKKGAFINPVTAASSGPQIYDAKSGALLERIEFDVQVSVSNSSSSSDCLSVGEVTVDSGQHSDKYNTSSNRIKFSVTVLLPTSGGYEEQ